MPVVANTHPYNEMVNVDYEFMKSGKVKILWGLITWPRGKWKQNFTHTGLCKVCGKVEFLPEHGYFKLDSQNNEAGVAKDRRIRRYR